jgi:hypothetical protein
VFDQHVAGSAKQQGGKDQAAQEQHFTREAVTHDGGVPPENAHYSRLA